MNKKIEKTTKFDKELYNKICLSYIYKYKQPEEWRRVIIDGITTRYAISNYGRIINLEKNKIPSIYNHNGHYGIWITLDTGKHRYFGTYRLVALMFLPSPKEYLEKGYTTKDLVVDHKRDGDIDNFDDNTMWNLQWLTHRENISKAAKCGYREAFDIKFKDKLDEMILDGWSNKDIYEVCLSEFGYTKEDIKAMIQIRRRRLGKTLKEHHEHDVEYVKKVDKLILDGFSNKEIIEKLDMPTSGRSSGRLLQYRRSILKVPSQVSKYFTDDENKVLNKLIQDGSTTNEIIKYFDLEKLDKETFEKVKGTIKSRICLYKKSQVQRLSKA